MNALDSGVALALLVSIVACILCFLAAARLGRATRKPVAPQRAYSRPQCDLDGLRKALKEASTADGCWGVIKYAYTEFGFTEVAMELGERQYVERTNRSQLPRKWTLIVPLTQGNSVLLSREFDALATPMVAGFVDVLEEVLSQKDFAHPKQHDQRSIA